MMLTAAAWSTWSVLLAAVLIKRESTPRRSIATCTSCGRRFLGDQGLAWHVQASHPQTWEVSR